MIALGCDHGGYELKQEVIAYLEKNGLEYKDFGCYSTEAVDYPVYAKLVAKAIQSGECEKGILICGTGVGISIAANKVNGVRAAVCSDCATARLVKEHNNANIIAFGARIVGSELAKDIVKAYLDAEFQGGRHQTRIDMIHEIETRN